MWSGNCFKQHDIQSDDISQDFVVYSNICELLSFEIK